MDSEAFVELRKAALLDKTAWLKCRSCDPI